MPENLIHILSRVAFALLRSPHPHMHIEFPDYLEIEVQFNSEGNLFSFVNYSLHLLNYGVSI